MKIKDREKANKLIRVVDLDNRKSKNVRIKTKKSNETLLNKIIKLFKNEDKK